MAAQQAESERTRQQEEQRREQMSQQSQFSNFSTNQTTTTSMLNDQSVAQNARQRRQQAVAEGKQAEERLHQRTQQILFQLAPCPANLGWYSTGDGYLCTGGNHFIEDAELDRLLDNPAYGPMLVMQPVNMRGPMLNKPPADMLRWCPAWVAYEEALQDEQETQRMHNGGFGGGFGGSFGGGFGGPFGGG